jgi:hypothetical protein
LEYLGSVLSQDGRLDDEIKETTGAAGKLFNKIKNQFLGFLRQGLSRKERKDDPEKLGSKKLTAVEKRGGRSQDRKEWKEM